MSYRTGWLFDYLESVKRRHAACIGWCDVCQIIAAEDRRRRERCTVCDKETVADYVSWLSETGEEKYRHLTCKSRR